MLETPTKVNRFQMSYNKEEVKRLVPMEYRLMETLGIENRCDLHKHAIKFLNSAVGKNAHLLIA